MFCSQNYVCCVLHGHILHLWRQKICLFVFWNFQWCKYTFSKSAKNSLFTSRWGWGFRPKSGKFYFNIWCIMYRVSFEHTPILIEYVFLIHRQIGLDKIRYNIVFKIYFRRSQEQEPNHGLQIQVSVQFSVGLKTGKLELSLQKQLLLTMLKF